MNRPSQWFLAAFLISLFPAMSSPAAECTVEEVIKLKNAGFSEEYISQFCRAHQRQSTSAPTKYVPPISVSSLTGTWEGRENDGAFARLVIAPDGEYSYQVIGKDRRVWRSWGRLTVSPLGPGKAVMNVHPQGFDPRDAPNAYKQGLISAPITLLDRDTMESSVFALSRVQ